MSEHHEKSYLFGYVRRSAAAVAVALLLAGMPVVGVLAQDAAPGSLDETFGAAEDDGTPAGVVSISFSDGHDEVVDLEIEADGHIVVAGNSFDGETVTGSWIARILDDGSVDPAFGASEDDGTPAGIVAVLMGGEGGDEIDALAVTEDGHILVAGHHDDNGSHSAWIARYHEDGTLDVEFGASEDDGTPAGFVSLSVGDGDEDVHAIEVTADGHILVAGHSTSTEDGSSSFMIARLHDDGSLDEEFGAGADDGSAAGVVLLSFGDGDDEAHAMHLEPDGHLIVVGDAVHEGSSDIIVVRLLEDGSLDESFGEAGVVDLSLGDGNDEAVGVELDDADGHIFVLGNTTSQDGSVNFFIAHLDENGALDETFGVDAEDGTPAGVLAGSISDSDDVATHLAMESDGHLIVVGHTDLDGDGNDDMFVARVTADGAFDETFGAGSEDGSPAGVATFSLSDGEDHAHTVHVEEDGHIVVAGTAGGNAIVLRVIGD